MTLKTCGKPNCNPIEQTRGKMKGGDFHDVTAAHSQRGGAIPDPHLYGVPANSPEAEDANVEHIVEAPEDGKTDVRIVCTACGKATGWAKADAAGMPGVGKMHSEKVWNKKV